MPFRPPPIRLSVIALGGSLALGACSQQSIQSAFPPTCPHVAILADAADLTRFRAPGSRDLTDMVLDGRITAVGGSCERGDDGQLLTTLSASVELARGPSLKGREQTAPVFVAVVRDGRVLDKQLFRVAATFPANTDRVRIASSDVSLVLPVSGGVTGGSYDIYVGFQLSSSELATNRARGPR